MKRTIALAFAISLLLLDGVCSAHSIRLIWSPSQNPGTLRYGIYRSVHMDSSFHLIDTVVHPDTVYVDADIPQNDYLYYAATCMDASGNESGFSNIITMDLSTVPVELSDFSIRLRGDDAMLQWTTLSESNNFGFEVQRSADATFFEKVGFVKGNGSTTVKKEYRFVDRNLKYGVYDYRLKQIDDDGTWAFSPVLSITVGVSGEVMLSQNYPNPFNAWTKISYHLPVAGLMKLTIYNTNGQHVSTLVDAHQEAGLHEAIWNGLDQQGVKVSSGIYYFKIETTHHVIFRKMILLN